MPPDRSHYASHLWHSVHLDTGKSSDNMELQHLQSSWYFSGVSHTRAKHFGMSVTQSVSLSVGQHIFVAMFQENIFNLSLSNSHISLG